MTKSKLRVVVGLILIIVLGSFFLFTQIPPTQANPDLTITPLTWNIVGLDSNSPAVGPRYFPVAARVCSTGPTAAGVRVSLVWENANATLIRTRALTSDYIDFPAFSAAGCVDAYFEIEIEPISAAFDQTRPYHITATSGAESVSTPSRELFVEHLVSQSRNSTDMVYYSTTLAGLSAPSAQVNAGGTMTLYVGESYYIRLRGGTATQGYEQFEQFLTLTNTIFRINSVSTLYAANSSPRVSNPSDMLYADACL